VFWIEVLVGPYALFSLKESRRGWTIWFGLSKGLSRNLCGLEEPLLLLLSGFELLVVVFRGSLGAYFRWQHAQMLSLSAVT
jgi:hypothetical protein